MGDAARAVESVERFLHRHVEATHAPGMAVALTDRQRTLAVLTSGYAELAAKTPVVPEHLFQIGSISKGFTAIALLQEREAGRLDLEAPVTAYLPWFEVRSRFAPITIHHLLSHSSGIVQGTDYTAEALHEVWSLRETETGFPPGEGYLYSNAGFKALGLVLEAVAGKPWWEVVRERILEPLEMTSTDPITTHDTRRRLAVGYWPPYDDRPWHTSHGWVEATWVESGTADGTICSPVGELAAYARLLLNDGAGAAGPVISPESFALMTQRATPAPDEGAFYGYGVRWLDESGLLLLGHSGSTLGYCGWVLTDPQAGIGAAVLANAYVERLSVVRYAVSAMRAAVLGEEVPPPSEPDSPARVRNAEEFVGEYRSPRRRMSIVAEGEGLALELEAGRVPFERRSDDDFVVPNPAFELFPLRFVREGDSVVAATHGPDHYVRDGEPVDVPSPVEWDAFVGHWRSHDPWFSNFRVFVRSGRLVLAGSTADDEGDWELTALPDGSFRVGDERSPDRVVFDTVIDRRATRAVFDAAPFYRTFTP